MEGLCSMKQSVRLFHSASWFFFPNQSCSAFWHSTNPVQSLQNFKIAKMYMYIDRHSNHNVRDRPQYYWAPYLLKKEGGVRFATRQLFSCGWLLIPVPGKLFACIVIFSNHLFFLQKMDVWVESWWASSHHEILTSHMNQTCPGL